MPESKEILFMLRLYSGFVESIRTGVWKPSGTPAIFKLLEGIQTAGVTSKIYLYCPQEFEETLRTTGGRILLEGFSAPIYIMKCPYVFNVFPSRVRDILGQLYWAFISLKIAWNQGYSIFYTDRGNIIGGALVARFSRMRTVIRLLGMPTEMASLLTSKRPTAKIFRWAYRSHFSAVIGTRDGSSIKPFLSNALEATVPYFIKINGVDDLPVVSSLAASSPLRIGFIGRLSRGKGAEQLIESAKEISNENFEIRVAGYGPDMASLQEQIYKQGLDKYVKLLGRIPHAELVHEISTWDVYVSLNEYGQISNANLEACKAGLCLMLAATKDADDADSIKFYKEDTACWVSQEKLPERLAHQISTFLNHPEDVKKYKKRTREFAKNLEDWHNRIQWEIDTLLKLDIDDT